MIPQPGKDSLDSMKNTGQLRQLGINDKKVLPTKFHGLLSSCLSTLFKKKSDWTYQVLLRFSSKEALLVNGITNMFILKVEVTWFWKSIAGVSGKGVESMFCEVKYGYKLFSVWFMISEQTHL